MQAIRKTDEVLVDIVNTIGRLKEEAPKREYYLMNTKPFSHKETIYVMNAIDNNDTQQLQTLASSGIDLSKSCGIALSYAVSKGSNDCVSYLIHKVGINPHVDNDSAMLMAAATNNAKAVGIMLDSANFNDYSLSKALDMAVQSKAEDATDVLLATYQFTSKQLLRLTEQTIHMGLNRMAKNLHTAAYTAIISNNRTERQAKDESYRLSKENEKRGTFIRV